MAQSISNILSNTNANSTTPYKLKTPAINPYTNNTYTNNINRLLKKPAQPVFGVPETNQSIVPVKTNVPLKGMSDVAPVKPLVATPMATKQNSTINNPTANNQNNTPGDVNMTSKNITPNFSSSNVQSNQNNFATSGQDNGFAGLVSRIIGSSKPTSDQKKLIQLLQDTAAKNESIGNDARGIADKYSQEINRIGGLGAGAVAGNLSTGTNVVGAGNAAIASQSASARMQALGNAEQAALQGTGQQFTGLNQTANTYSDALSSANVQQAQQQSALGTAAGFAQPQVTGFGQTAFNPLEGSFGGGSANLDPQQVSAQLAQDVVTGRKTYEQAISSLGYAGGAGQQFLNNAIQGINPNFNIPQSQATVGGQTGVLGQLPQMQAADSAAEGIRNKIDTYLESNPGLNTSGLAAGNLLQQWIQGKQLADPKYQTLFNYLNEYTNTLTPILGIGGDSTNLKTEIAQSFVNGAASGKSISEVLQNMQNLSRGKIQDLRSGATGGGAVSSSSGGTSFAEQW